MERGFLTVSLDPAWELRTFTLPLSGPLTKPFFFTRGLQVWRPWGARGGGEEDQARRGVDTSPERQFEEGRGDTERGKAPDKLQLRPGRDTFI